MRNDRKRDEEGVWKHTSLWLSHEGDGEGEVSREETDKDPSTRLRQCLYHMGFLVIMNQISNHNASLNQ